MLLREHTITRLFLIPPLLRHSVDEGRDTQQEGVLLTELILCFSRMLCRPAFDRLGTDIGTVSLAECPTVMWPVARLLWLVLLVVVK